jgi:transposase-like protein
MAKYSKEFKDNIIKQMLPPNSKLVRVLSKETGVSEQTLYKWKREMKASGQATPSGNSSTELWSSEDKFLIVLETARLNEAELAEYCRKRGIYVEQVKAWKDACMSANGSVAEESKTLKKELKEKDKELKKVSKDLKRKEAALAETAALLVLRKKAQAIWGDNEDE